MKSCPSCFKRIGNARRVCPYCTCDLRSIELAWERERLTAASAPTPAPEPELSETIEALPPPSPAKVGKSRDEQQQQERERANRERQALRKLKQQERARRRANNPTDWKFVACAVLILALFVVGFVVAHSNSKAASERARQRAIEEKAAIMRGHGMQGSDEELAKNYDRVKQFDEIQRRRKQDRQSP